VVFDSGPLRIPASATSDDAGPRSA
jgi:hypothetical protein